MTMKLVSLGDLLARPQVPVDYVWQGRLVAGTVSIIAAKPKVGKSTLARNLALAVAQGKPFLGWPVKRGPVLYFSLEERSEDVTNDFRAMGADGHEDIQIADAASVPEMVTMLKDKKPTLLVVDPLFRLVRVQEGNSYSQLYEALGPLIDTARETGTHILCSHHSSKIAKASAIDAPIGSTALGGAVSTLLVMRRTESIRTLETVQRIGEDLPETVLTFDTVARRLSLGELRESAEVTSLGTVIMKILANANKPKTEPEICEAVQSKNHPKRKAIRELTQLGQITRSGSGKRGDPYKYEVPRSLVPSFIENNRCKKPFEGVYEGASEGTQKLVPIIHNIIEDKGTRNVETLGECLNIDKTLVPAKTENSANSEKPGTSNSGWWSTVIAGLENPQHRSRHLRRRSHDVTALRRRPRRR